LLSALLSARTKRTPSLLPFRINAWSRWWAARDSNPEPAD
jgi:hypothetical protein